MIWWVVADMWAYGIVDQLVALMELVVAGWHYHSQLSEDERWGHDGLRGRPQETSRQDQEQHETLAQPCRGVVQWQNT